MVATCWVLPVDLHWHTMLAPSHAHKRNPTMNLITQYGLCGLVLMVGVDSMLQNLVPPYVCLEPTVLTLLQC